MLPSSIAATAAIDGRRAGPSCKQQSATFTALSTSSSLTLFSSLGSASSKYFPFSDNRKIPHLPFAGADKHHPVTVHVDSIRYGRIGEPFRRKIASCASHRREEPGLFAANEFREAEIGNLDAAYVVEEDVLGLDVAVDDLAVAAGVEEATAAAFGAEAAEADQVYVVDAPDDGDLRAKFLFSMDAAGDAGADALYGYRGVIRELAAKHLTEAAGTYFGREVVSCGDEFSVAAQTIDSYEEDSDEENAGDGWQEDLDKIGAFSGIKLRLRRRILKNSDRKIPSRSNSPCRGYGMRRSSRRS
ncbi:hypothetical protein M5K25_020322 [Dendrobium thyrsiflorum]|uniref:Uncharacterized protein n=1 Tax=Dendrobium thyrsiflorum TaxID=117978 RepID=A0ABD0U9K3_DENTH